MCSAAYFVKALIYKSTSLQSFYIPIQKHSKKLLKHLYTKISVDYQNMNELVSTTPLARPTEVFAQSLAGLTELEEPCIPNNPKGSGCTR